MTLITETPAATPVAPAEAASERAIIELRGVKKRFGRVEALKGVTLDIQQGEFFSLLGPSGCGKTTLLRLIAGFEDPSEGDIGIDGHSMKGVDANHRPTNMVFQSYAIFPHLNVADNVGFGLRKLKLAKQNHQQRVEKALAMVDLAGYGERRANQLSGGQRQRVALARALVMRPKVLLLDEPLSALDKKLREQMQVELRQLQRAVGITFILVTHDQEEALTMSDRIAVMFHGEVAQLASPEDLYKRPINRNVGSFIGVMNFLDAEIEAATSTQLIVDVAGLGRIETPKPTPAPMVGARTSVGVRPEMLTLLMTDADSAEREIPAEIVNTQYFGDMTYYDVALPNVVEPVMVSMRNTIGRSVLAAGAKCRVGFSTESVLVFSD